MTQTMLMHRIINRRRLSCIATLAIVFYLAPFHGRTAHAASSPGPCDPPILNPIVCENSKPGNWPSEWDITDAGDPSIQGFATDISVNKGQTIRFKVKTTASSYRLDIYRIGYYGGRGARKVATVQPSVTLPQAQPACRTNASTGLIDCGNWAQSATWTVPADATSGVYLAKLVRPDTGGASHIVFIVRDDGGNSDLLFQTADTTWQAYNDYGGNSLYVGPLGVSPGSPDGRAYKVSYNRPFNTRGNIYRRAWFFGAEYPMIRWLEANGYNVSYFSGVDSDRRSAEILEHKVFLSIGHDEYWSGAQRANVEAARASGIHLAFFSGDEVFWKIRWENSIDGSNTPYRTLVCYKETHADAKIDPLPNVWTGTWRDPRFSPPADGGRPENALTGTIFTVNCCSEDSITVPEALGKLRFWRNTSIANLAPGATGALPIGTLGYEWDENLDNGFRPLGLVPLSSTTVDVSGYLLDYGSTFGSGTATHSLTLYRHSSGALVFGAGTIRWSWGLDGNHDFDDATPNASTAPDRDMQQATVNLLADMGAQPGTLQADLFPATASTDTTAPTSTITSPTSGSTVQTGTPITITGTAADTGGGLVAGVEVSVDGGATWGPVTGRESWSYPWTPEGTGSATIRSRAVDDSGNLETPSAGVTVTVGTDLPTGFTDTTVLHFSAGTPDANTFIAQMADGEVLLRATVDAEFAGTVLPTGWFGTAWDTGGSATVGSGVLTVDGARAGTTALYGPGRSLEFVATLSGAAWQHVGFGTDFNSPPWIIFSTNTGGGLYARTHTGTTATDTPIPGSWLGAPHRYRIDWNASSVVFSIDGTVVATHPVTITANLRPLASDYTVGGGGLSVDWLRLTPYVAAGTFLSRVFDAGAVVPWGTATWTADTPAGTSLTLSVRTGNTPSPDGTWTAFQALPSSGAPIGGSSRYLQYRAQLATSAPGQTPVLREVTITSGP